MNVPGHPRALRRNRRLDRLASRTGALLLVALALAACATLPAPAPAPVAGGAERLPSHPGLVQGALPNGFAYVVGRHPNPSGRVAAWLHVATGSLNETDETRGLAHFLEHMAFNGSANFPPGTLIPFFQSLGMAFGRDQNAFTSLDQTVYTLALPDTKPETIERGFLYLADVAYHLNLSAREIDDERQIVLEEKRARSGARQRVRDAVLARLAPESTLGRRLPIGTDETIRALGPAEFREYYRRWYVPGNMTLIALGDVEPAVLVESIARHFAGPPAGPRPEPRPVGVRATAGTRGIVVTDPELTEAEISLMRAEPPQPPVTTVPAYRAELVERVGTWLFNRRLEADLAEGRARLLKASASIGQWSRALRVVSADATAAPDRWQAALDDLAVALQRARRHGFSAGEIDEARTALIADAELAVRQEPTLPARAVLRRINAAVSHGEPVMSAEQRLALRTRLLPSIAADEVSRAFAAAFDPANVVVVLTLPDAASAPAEARLVEVGRAALAVDPPPLPERERVARLLAAPPAGGAVVAEQAHEATSVWSGWLDNGARVHHRRVDQRRNQASIQITFAGGVIEERPEDRGLTEAAGIAWDRPATRGLTSTQIRSLMTGKKVRVGGGHGPDTLTLAISGDPAELETGLELAYLLMTEPVLEAAGFEQWRTRRLQEIAERAVQPRGVLAEAQADAFYPPGEARLWPLTAAQVGALTRERAEAWLRAIVARAPVEVSVVGDIDREAAVRLAARYVGSLPARPRIGDKTLADLRSVPRPAGPIAVSRAVATRTDQAYVLGGFFGNDLTNVRDGRLLALAARVLSTRMNRVLREERQLVYSIGAGSRPAEAYPGFGLFTAQAPTDPAKARALADAIDEMIAALAAEGPTEEELGVARQQLVNQIDEALRGPEFWSDRLATLDYRGIRLDDLARLLDDLGRYTAAEVGEAVARYARPEARFRFVILPEPPK